MSLAIFNDCKPWYIREGKNDMCLCRTCEDFRLAKKAVLYNHSILKKPYTLRPAARFMRFFYCAIKASREVYGVSGYRDPLILTRGKLYYRIIQQFHFLRRTKTTIIELCCSGRSMDKIVDRVFCYQSMPKGDSRCRPKCYGQCDEVGEFASLA